MVALTGAAIEVSNLTDQAAFDPTLGGSLSAGGGASLDVAAGDTLALSGGGYTLTGEDLAAFLL